MLPTLIILEDTLKANSVEPAWAVQDYHDIVFINLYDNASKFT